MLACEPVTVITTDNQTDKDVNSIFLTTSQLAAYMTAIQNNAEQNIFIIDCGLPLRHTERRIQNSFLLNVNDKISRKRLATRGIKNFLANTQLDRLNQNEIIILYDDTIRPTLSCANSTIPMQLSSSMKCVYDQIKLYDTNKIIYILQSSFDEFYQHYPSLCYISTSTDEDQPPSPLSSLLTIKPLDIESYQMSEIIPGLYLGNSHDAENINLLKQNNIQTIINISTSIPCYFENEKCFDYQQLPCHDSSSQNILQYFETTFEYMDEKLSSNKNILVHCQGGVSRSPSFIIGYLMKYHSKTFDEAHQLVKSKRNIVNPNLNFLGQLIQYQQILNSA
ncbi:unnamed protein product [Adineta steineri]|uniref:protein-tyrosine-phosphatase n=1 Tax=Adineta steineri TaxID=433720 RepID=A0A816AQ53_9BILA|nr:unnamed protein product [Adineta steineri]